MASAMLVAGGCGDQKVTTPSRSAARSIATAGVQLVVPDHWFASSAVLPQGRGTGFAWLQATNFPIQTLARAEDARKAMGPNDVVLTIFESSRVDGIARRLAAQQFQLTPADALPSAQTPRGHEDLQVAKVIAARSFTIDADFGSPAGARRLLAAVNRIVGLLHVNATRP